MTIQVPADLSGTKRELVTNLQCMYMLKAVDAAPVTHRKCPCLSWLLDNEELPFTWVERQLEETATWFVKKWAGLAKLANTSLFYLPLMMGGLNLPSKN